jgi:hypothetical protein
MTTIVICPGCSERIIKKKELLSSTELGQNELERSSYCVLKITLLRLGLPQFEVACFHYTMMRGKVNKGRKVNYMEQQNKLNIRYRENALYMKRGLHEPQKKKP